MKDSIDTTNCPEALKSYSQWDKEVVDEIELEKLRESFLRLVTSPQGFQEFSWFFDDIDNQEVSKELAKLSHTALIGFFGSPADRLSHRKLVITFADRLAQKLFRILEDEGTKRAVSILNGEEGGL